ncbi:hypothetical protein PITC_092610 [Penicillium italicum]|uniref:Uncharacterized protein n=1 Tax=Penicillium italicum TaxID=40296 RepID=A0A0A2LDM9_PENIT|nr:hypothetical protein PITC_092610 [Penicillium italicum]
MSLSDSLLDSYNCPVFLRCCDAYKEYILKTEARELKLPPYTTNPAGQAIVYHGEVFCRVPSCSYKHIAISATNNLRQHLLRHGVQLAANTAGRLTQAKKDAAIKWYNSLFKAEESDDHEDGDEESDGDGHGDGHAKDDDEEYAVDDDEDYDEDDD